MLRHSHKKYVSTYYETLIGLRAEIAAEYSFAECFRDYRWAFVVYVPLRAMAAVGSGLQRVG